MASITNKKCFLVTEWSCILKLLPYVGATAKPNYTPLHKGLKQENSSDKKVNVLVPLEFQIQFRIPLSTEYILHLRESSIFHLSHEQKKNLVVQKQKNSTWRSHLEALDSFVGSLDLGLYFCCNGWRTINFVKLFWVVVLSSIFEDEGSSSFLLYIKKFFGGGSRFALLAINKNQPHHRKIFWTISKSTFSLGMGSKYVFVKSQLSKSRSQSGNRISLDFC